MSFFSNFIQSDPQPEPEVTEQIASEAKRCRNSTFELSIISNSSAIKPDPAVVGAWRVDDNGEIVEGSWEGNTNFMPELADQSFDNVRQYNQWLKSTFKQS